MTRQILFAGIVWWLNIDRKTGKEFSWKYSYKEEERSANIIDNNLGEKMRDILTALEADEEISSLEEEEIVIIEEIAKVLKIRKKDKLPVTSY